MWAQKTSWSHPGYWKELGLHSEMIKDRAREFLKHCPQTVGPGIVCSREVRPFFEKRQEWDIFDPLAAELIIFTLIDYPSFRPSFGRP